MTKEEAIKYLQQLYPNGGHCRLDEQRTEAIGMAIQALQEEPVNKDFEMALAEMIDKAQKCVVEPLVIAAQWKDELIELAKSEEPVSEQKLSNVERTIKDWKEESVGNPIDFEKELYKAFGQVKDFTLGMRIAKWFYDMGRKHNEPVSEELDSFAKRQADEFAEREYEVGSYDRSYLSKGYYWGCKAGANWQKNHLWKPADGDDLPIIDREVIALLDYDFGHYKVVYAHRPNPNGWNGTNIDTEEKEHFEPATYGKGGWNQPHVLYWLDTKMPYEEK